MTRRPHLQDAEALAFYDHYRAFRKKTLNQAIEEIGLYHGKSKRLSEGERKAIRRAIEAASRIVVMMYEEPSEEMRAHA